MKVTTISLLSAIALSISSTQLIAEEPVEVVAAATTVAVDPAAPTMDAAAPSMDATAPTMDAAAPSMDGASEGDEVKKECITAAEAEEMAKSSAEAAVDEAKADEAKADEAKADEAKDGETVEALPLCEEEKPVEGTDAPAEVSADAPAEGEKAEVPAEESAK